MTEGYTIIWDLSFGAISQKKKIFLLETRPGNFAEDLFNRYKAIYDLGEEVLCFNNGAIELDKLNELIPEESINETSQES